MTLRCRILGHNWWPDPNGAYQADRDVVRLVCSRCSERIEATDPFPYLKA